MFMKKLIFSFIVLNGLLLGACRAPSGASEERTVFDYKNTFVGDNSSIGSLAAMLNVGTDGFSLSTGQAPYGITFRDSYLTREEVLYAAAVIFQTVVNADWVTFEELNADTTIFREEMDFYLEGQQFSTENQLIDFLNEKTARYGLPDFL